MGMKRLIDAEHLKNRIKSDSNGWSWHDLIKVISMIDTEPTQGIDGGVLFELIIAIFVAVCLTCHISHHSGGSTMTLLFLFPPILLLLALLYWIIF